MCPLSRMVHKDTLTFVGIICRKITSDAQRCELKFYQNFLYDSSNSGQSVAHMNKNIY